MTLIQIIQILKQIALTQPNIKSATDGSIYEVMNTNPSVKYDVVHFSQTTHQSDEETDYYGLNIFYVSRLEDSLEDNRLQIQSIGKEILDNIIRTFCENWGIDFPIITYTPFTQKFNDLCAGCYCNLRLEIPKEIICADDYTAEVVPGSGIKLQDIGITITQNGLVVVTPDAEYDGIGEVRIEVDVPQSAAVLQDKEVEYTENGSYTVHPDPAYDGLSSVSVDVDVPDRYDEGYDDGKTDGENEQKAKLTVTSFTENNTYTRENGWSAVTVDVPSDYQDGYDDGVADQKAKLSTTSVTENGTYTSTDGYSVITVDVPQGQGYEEGYEDGEAAQKAKLTVTSFTENNTYTREDGWSAVTINVPSDYQDGYDDGYEDGYAAGASACSGLFITAITLNVDSSITDSATATTTFAPLTSITDIYYTSSDPSIAAIDPETGVITAISDGSVTICTNDRWSNLKDCKTVAVAVTPTGITAITFTVPSAITDSANTSVSFSPNDVPTNIIYTSSDTSKATIDDNGVITVLEDGTVTFCAIDTLTNLADCKTAAVTKSAPTPIPLNYTADTSDVAASGETRTIILDLTGFDPATVTVNVPGATTSMTNNVVSIVFPNNTGLPKTYQATVSATSYQGYTASFSLTYNQLCSSAALDGALMIKYKVTSTTEPTQVVTTSSIAKFASYAIYNGKAYNINSKNIKFPRTGELWVYYVLKDPTMCPGAFNGYTVPTPTASTPVTVLEARLPDTITGTGNYCFYGQQELSSVTLGNSVQRLGRYSFTHCPSLQRINIPLSYTGHTYMDTVNGAVQVFAGNTNNLNVYYAGNTTDWNRIAFKGYGSNPLYQGGKLYVNSTGFSGTLINNLTIPSAITSVNDFAFDGCGSITAVTIHSGVTRLGYACFRDCPNLTKVTDNRATPQTLATDWVGCLVGTDDILQFYVPEGGTEYPIYVPSASVNAYKTAEGWKREYVDRIQAKP